MSGSAGAMNGTGGAEARAGNSGMAGAAVMLAPEAPKEVRHVTLGAPVAAGCLSSVVPTTAGVRYAGRDNWAALAGIGSLDSEGRWHFTQDVTPGDISGSALVFGDATGQVVAWPSNATTGIGFEFFDADGLAGVSETDAQGEPLAAVGTLSSFSLAFSSANELSLLEFQNGTTVVTPVDTDGCVEPSSVAIGTFQGDTVLGYFCNRFSTSGAAQHLLVARVSAATHEVEKAALDVPVGSSATSGLANSGVPAAFFHDGELLFAHQTAQGNVALTRVSAADLAVRTELVTGMPSTAIHANEKNPVFSVVQVGDQVGLTRAVCNGHEDDNPTGTFDLCRISAVTLEAVCSEVEDPCEQFKLVADGSDVTLVGCGSPTFIPLDLAAIPVEQPGYFPTGYSWFEPLSLTCDGDACSALLAVNSSRLTTGYDLNLAFADLELAPGCNAETCRASSPTPTAVFSEVSHNPSAAPSITLQRQIAGLPVAVATLAPDDQAVNYRAQVSVLDRDGVRWTQPVPSSAAALFPEGDGYLGIWSDFSPYSLNRYSVSAGNSVVDSNVLVHTGGWGLPGVALCAGKVLIDGVTQESFTSPLEAAIMSFDPASGALQTLFTTGYRVASTSAPARSIGCAGDRVLVLDELAVHQYSTSGERGPDIALGTPPATAAGDMVFTQLETRGDHVLVASSNSIKNALDVLLFYADGTNRAFELPLAPNTVPLVSLAVAPDRGDGWLRLLYQSGRETARALGEGFVYASAYELFE